MFKKFITIIKNWFARKVSYQGTGTTVTSTACPITPEPETIDGPESAETITEEIVGIENTVPITETINTRLVVLIDNGHASTTPGKRSPDGQLREYEFNRDIASRISKELIRLGIRNYIIVPEIDVDVTLSKRAERANNYCNIYGKSNCLLISIHVNASGIGTEWMGARGWSVWTTKGKTRSDEYADIFWEEMNKILPGLGITMRKDTSDGDKDYEENFTVLYKTKCPALLTENLFMDNQKDKRFLMTEEGREAIARGHINAILEIAKTF